MNEMAPVSQPMSSRTAFESLRDIVCEVPIGFAQVMLQPSHLVGLAFIAGTLWNSWIIAAFGMIGCIAGIATAFALRYPDEERREGLYGFNGTLVGLGCSYFFQPSWPLLALVAVGGGVSSVLMHAMLRHDLKPFTFPFVVNTWMIFAILAITDWAVPVTAALPTTERFLVLEALSRGAGQVLFQEAVLTGLLFVAAIAIRDWIQGLYAALATGAGLAAGYAFGLPIDAVNLGLFGYNGVLCAILFAGPGVGSFVSAVAATALSILIVRLFHIAGLPAFTFPFVLSSWIVLWLHARFSRQ
jgi:urea transporter